MLSLGTLFFFIVSSSEINTIVSQSLHWLLSTQRSQRHVGVNVHVTHTWSPVLGELSVTTHCVTVGWQGQAKAWRRESERWLPRFLWHFFSQPLLVLLLLTSHVSHTHAHTCKLQCKCTHMHIYNPPLWFVYTEPSYCISVMMSSSVLRCY